MSHNPHPIILPGWLPQRRRRHPYRIGLWLAATTMALAAASSLWLVLSRLQS